MSSSTIFQSFFWVEQVLSSGISLLHKACTRHFILCLELVQPSLEHNTGTVGGDSQTSNAWILSSNAQPTEPLHSSIVTSLKGKRAQI